jgi:hypothetical protein
MRIVTVTALVVVAALLLPPSFMLTAYSLMLLFGWSDSGSTDWAYGFLTFRVFPFVYAALLVLEYFVSRHVPRVRKAGMVTKVEDRE